MLRQVLHSWLHPLMLLMSIIITVNYYYCLQESSPSCSVENELTWQRIKLERLYQVLPLLTSLSDRLTSAMDSGNLPEFV